MLVLQHREGFGKVFRKLRTDKAVSREWVIARIRELGFPDPICTDTLKKLETSRRKKPSEATLTQLTAVFPALAAMYPRAHG